MIFLDKMKLRIINNNKNLVIIKNSTSNNNFTLDKKKLRKIVIIIIIYIIICHILKTTHLICCKLVDTRAHLYRKFWQQRNFLIEAKYQKGQIEFYSALFFKK